jgi:hypothetical protein
VYRKNVKFGNISKNEDSQGHISKQLSVKMAAHIIYFCVGAVATKDAFTNKKYNSFVKNVSPLFRRAYLFIPYFSLVVAFEGCILSIGRVETRFLVNSLHGFVNGIRVGSAFSSCRRWGCTKRLARGNSRKGGSISGQKSSGNKSSVELHGREIEMLRFCVSVSFASFFVVEMVCYDVG